jgi:hypothetical protein
VTPVSEDRDVDPEWSPDGKKIVFVRNGEIWVMNSDGSGQTQLTFERTKVIELAKKKQKEENTKRKQALEKALQEERTGAAIPQDEPPAQPLGKGPLSGTWQASAGAQFRIDDDGATATIELGSGDILQTFSGKLTRGNKGPDSKVLTGTLDAVFTPDAPKRYAIRVVATVADQDHLRLRCSDWPSWNNVGKKLGTRTLNETWTRQQ